MTLKLSGLRSEERHPVAAGLIALAAVAVALGLVAAVVAFVGAGVLGVGGGPQTAQAAGDGVSLYLPTPSPTASRTGALITLSPDPTADAGASTSGDPATETPATKPPGITLSAGETTVGSMDRIDLSGVYTGGEGAVLQVQRREGGHWTDFPVTAGVSGEQFSTYVQTGHTGRQQWRVKDTDSGRSSNAVTVTVG